MVPNRDTMRTSLLLPQCWVGTSVIALLSGVIMVLVFSRLLIVPYLLTEDYVSTDCLVYSIEIQHDTRNGSLLCGELSMAGNKSVDRNQTYCSSHPHVTAEGESPMRPGRSSLGGESLPFCVRVKVSYRAFDGLIRQALLQLSPWTEAIERKRHIDTVSTSTVYTQ